MPFDENLTLPSRCYLVKVNISNKLYNSLIREANAINISSTLSNRVFNDSPELSQQSETNNSDTESNDLTMDLLPDSFRFTSAVSMRSASNMLDDLIAAEDEDDQNDDEDDDDEENNYGNVLTMYVQTNSRLKLILLSLNSTEEPYQIDNTIRVVSLFL